MINKISVLFNYRLIIPVLLLLILNACGPQIYFSEPQPANMEALSTIPSKLQGAYIDEKSDTLFLLKQSYLWAEKQKVQIPLDKLQEKFEADLQKEKLLFTLAKKHYSVPYQVLNDSIFFSYTRYSETLLSDTTVLKQMNKKLWVLNRLEKYGWTPLLIKRNRNKIKVFYIDNDKTGLLQEISHNVETHYKDENKKEVNYYLASPTQKEFEKFVSLKDALVEIGVFKKVR